MKEIKENVRDIVLEYFDNYFDATSCSKWRDLIKNLAETPDNYLNMYAFMDGMLDGLAQAEGYHREGINFRASPIQNIENRVQCMNLK
jgi:hypothetical protein